MRTFILYSVFVLFFVSLAAGAPLSNVPLVVVQPNGDSLHCFASGDEFYNWLHDRDGYTIIQDPVTGYYVYATLVNGELVPSPFVAGRVDPAGAGLIKGVKLSPERRQQKRQSYLSASQVIRRSPPLTGVLNNIMVFIRFSDQPEFTDPAALYDTMLNASGPESNSLYHYYREVSYGTLSIFTHFYPVATGSTVASYQDSHPRGYFMPYNAVTNPAGYQEYEVADREHTLLADALSSVMGQIPGSLTVDGDGDGYVDNVCFVVQGGPTAWSTLLWPHMWSLFSQSVYINGARVMDYNLQIQTMLPSRGVGILCHEMFHSLGSPDLYHYSSDGFTPVAQWDIMESDLNPPQHMGAYMKWRYGSWIGSIPEITSDGTYSLRPLTSATNNCYKIASPYSTSEYFVLEYRKQEGTFESSLPAQGLLVYRINTLYSGNAGGPPDEVYIYRPDGSPSTNGYPDRAPLSTNTARTSMAAWTNPSDFLTDGSPGGLNISNVGAADDSISFTVKFPAGSAWSGNVLIWDPDGTPLSGPVVRSLLENMGKSVDYTTLLSVVPNLSGYQAIFVFLGVNPHNHVLVEADASRLSAYLNGGGKLYLEGADAWAHDAATSLQAFFSLSGINDGAPDLSHVSGVGSTFTADMVFTYTGEFNSIDRLSPVGGAVTIFRNPDVGYDVGVANDQGVYKTIGVSFELGGLLSAQSPNTRMEVLAKILTFFGVPYSIPGFPPQNLIALDSFDKSAFLHWSLPWMTAPAAFPRGADPVLPATGTDNLKNHTGIASLPLSIGKQPEISSPLYHVNVYRAEAGDGPYSLIASNLAGSSYLDSGLTNGRRYYYALTSVTDSGESPLSPHEVGYPRHLTGAGKMRSALWSPSLSKFPYGIVIIGDTLCVTEYNESKIYLMNKNTGTIIGSFTCVYFNPTGLAWDGTAFWVGTASTSAVVRVDRTGGILQVIWVPYGTVAPLITGVAYENGHVWVSDRDNNRLLKFDASSGTLLGIVDEPAAVRDSMGMGPRGLAFDSHINALVHVITDFNQTPVQNYVYEYSLQAGQFTGRRFGFNRWYDPRQDTFVNNCRAIAYDSLRQSYWISDVDHGVLYEVASFNTDSIRTVDVAYSARWNMVSVPVEPADRQKTSVFPTAISNAFAYDGTYSRMDTLQTGMGYWVKFNEDQSIDMEGVKLLEDTITVDTNWHMIGSLSEPIAVSSIISDPPGMVASTVYGYEKRYIAVETIYPGKGYWVKANQPGNLILSSVPADHAKSSASHLRIVPTVELPPSPPGEEVPTVEANTPGNFALDEAYPNPFNPITTIRYQLPIDSRVKLFIYNTLGQVVSSLADEVQLAGYRSVEWNASEQASGMYFYRFEATGINDPGKTFTSVKKMLLVK